MQAELRKKRNFKTRQRGRTKNLSLARRDNSAADHRGVAKITSRQRVGLTDARQPIWGRISFSHPKWQLARPFGYNTQKLSIRKSHSWNSQPRHCGTIKKNWCSTSAVQPKTCSSNSRPAPAKRCRL